MISRVLIQSTIAYLHPADDLFLDNTNFDLLISWARERNVIIYYDIRDDNIARVRKQPMQMILKNAAFRLFLCICSHYSLRESRYENVRSLH